MGTQLVLDETWKRQLILSGWVAEQKQQGCLLSVTVLKDKWLTANPQGRWIRRNCFFCDYAAGCRNCPGKLVDKSFSCMTAAYDYARQPIKFHQKLVELNKQRQRRREAAELVWREFCPDCKGYGFEGEGCNRAACETFQEQVKQTMHEWEQEDIADTQTKMGELTEGDNNE